MNNNFQKKRCMLRYHKLKILKFKCNNSNYSSRGVSMINDELMIQLYNNILHYMFKGTYNNFNFFFLQIYNKLSKQFLFK